jgi:flagellar biosynthesis protein
MLKGYACFMPTFNPPPPGYTPTKAAALQYDKDKSAAPRLTAKGKGQLAEKIIELAREHNIPIQQDADLLHILDSVEVGAEIPLEVYAVVAEIFAYIYKVNQNKKGAA